MTDNVEEPNVIGGAGETPRTLTDEEIAQAQKVLGEMIKLKVYFDLLISGLGDQTKGVEMRTYFIGDTVPGEFVQFYKNGQEVNNDAYLRFVSNTILFGQSGSKVWLAIPFSFATPAIMSLNLEAFREEGVSFKINARFMLPNSHCLIETNQMALIQLLRNILSLPLNIFRDAYKRLKDRSYVS